MSKLGVPTSNVRVVLTRDGGAFGGRQTRSRFNSTATALAAWVTQRPVRLILDRATNFIMCGGRHPFRGDYHAAYAPDGTVKGFNVNYFSNGGNT